MSLVFLQKQEVVDIHFQLIEIFGGSHGLRDEGGLESSLAAAENRAHYEGADLAICAATYAYHLTQAHAFIDGNKRIAAAVAEAFIELNNARLEATNEQLIDLFLDIAASRLDRDAVEAIFRQWVEIK